jgi:membrane-associated phospholipid phosphatase
MTSPESPEPPDAPVMPSPLVFFSLSAVCLLFFAGWSWLVFHEPAIDAFDRRCAEFWRDFNARDQTFYIFMVYLTEIGGVPAMILLSVMGAIWQTAINHRFLATAWIGVMIGCGILNSTTKYFFDRDRPPESLRDRAVLETNKSYPSGHSMGSAIGYGMLGYALVLPQRRRPRRIVALLLIAVMILGVGFSRIYLRAHWFSDVIGGFAVGLAWLFFCLGSIEMYRLRKHHV